MGDLTKTDQKLIDDLRALLDQVITVRRGLLGKGFAPKGNGCVCEGSSLCAHHSAVYNRLNQAIDAVTLAIGEARREE